MSKSSFLNNKNINKSDIAIICILFMFCGLLVSRLFLSLGMVFFGINALWNVPPRQWLKNKWWLLGVGWVAMYAISWFWTTDKAEWGTYLQLKLPVLLLPLSFSFLPAFSKKQLQTMTVCIGLMMLGGVCYSLSFLVRDYAHFIKEYEVSHMLPTPIYKEYISFSVTCALFIIWTIFLWPRLLTNVAKWVLASTCVILFVYLHILASKSGIVAIYLFAFSWAIYVVFAKRSMAGILAVVAIPVFLCLAVTYIPTLQKRKAHIWYTYYRYLDNDKSAKLGDLSRLTSYSVSTRIIKQHPVAGVGMGDIMPAMLEGYAQWYPDVTEATNKLIPHNQFLTVALGCGIPTMLLFAWWVIAPLAKVRRNRDGFFLGITWSVLLIMLFIEPFLEGQFGVFIYLFFMLIVGQVVDGNSKGEIPNSKVDM